MGKIFTIFTLLFFLVLKPAYASTNEKTSDSSATFGDIQLAKRDDTRALVLQKYLENNDSPLAPFATLMVEEADKYALPWTLVAAIAGTEATFKFEPSANCHNEWGWGIYGSNVLCFPSYGEAIQTISKELRTRFIDRYGCQNVEDIGKFYASSPLWATHTAWFIKQIETYKTTYDRQYLSISL